MRKYELASLHLSTAGGVSQIDLIAKTDAINLKQMIQNKKKFSKMILVKWIRKWSFKFT